MKSRIFQLITLVLLFGILMTGCETLNYRKAVQLYNNRRYDEAIELFYELGEYEDSSALFQDSHYWAAMARMEDGNYAEALPRFLKLVDYKDSADRATECRYQLGIQAIAEGNYTDAEHYFRQLGNYRKTADYLRQVNWRKLYDYILVNGTETDGVSVITCPLDERIVTFCADASDPTQIRMVSAWVKDMGYSFRDSLTLIFVPDSTVTKFEAVSEFTMDFGDEIIGSQQNATGSMDLLSYVPRMQLTYNTFSMTTTDNHGQTTTTEDSINSTMDKTMSEHLVAIMNCFSALQGVANTDYAL